MSRAVKSLSISQSRLGNPLSIHTSAVTPWITDEDIRRDGVALVCAVEPVCIKLIQGFADHYGALPPEPFSVAHQFLYWQSPPTQYQIAIVLSHSVQQTHT
jgi:hypothetical protein